MLYIIDSKNGGDKRNMSWLTHNDIFQEHGIHLVVSLEVLYTQD